jgi:hypothetical protein
VPGASTGALTLHSSGGDQTMALSANAVTSGALTVDPAGGWAFGDVPVGETREATVVLRNTGSGVLRVLASEPPAGAPFTVLDGLPVGTAIAAGDARALRIRFAPASATDAGSAWRIATTGGGGSLMVPVGGRGIVVAAPDVGGESRPVLAVSKLRPGLSVTKALPSRDRRKLTVRGRVTTAATGPLSIRLRARAGRKTVTVLSSLRLRGHSTYTITLVLPKAARSWSRLEILARFAGSDRVWPGAGTLVVVRGR